MYTIRYSLSNTRRSPNGLPREYFVGVSHISLFSRNRREKHEKFLQWKVIFFIHFKEVGIRGYIATTSNQKQFLNLPKELRKNIVRHAVMHGALFEI